MMVIYKLVEVIKKLDNLTTVLEEAKAVRWLLVVKLVATGCCALIGVINATTAIHTEYGPQNCINLAMLPTGDGEMTGEGKSPCFINHHDLKEHLQRFAKFHNSSSGK